jgi:hypothetical protein
MAQHQVDKSSDDALSWASTCVAAKLLSPDNCMGALLPRGPWVSDTKIMTTHSTQMQQTHINRHRLAKRHRLECDKETVPTCVAAKPLSADGCMDACWPVLAPGPLPPARGTQPRCSNPTMNGMSHLKN